MAQKVQSDRKFDLKNRWAATILTGIALIFVAVVSVVIILFHFQIAIESKVFESLLVVISIFIGYNSVIFVFYLGKVEDSEKNFRIRFNKAVKFRDRFVSPYYELLEKFNKFQGQSFERQAAREQFISLLEDLEKKTSNILVFS